MKARSPSSATPASPALPPAPAPAPPVSPVPAASRWWRLGLLVAGAALLAWRWPWLRVPLTAGVLLVLLLAWFQSRLIYLPPHHPQGARPLGPAGVMVIAYRLLDAPQQAYYIPPRQPSIAGRLWLVFSGNASGALDWGSFVQACPDEHAAFLLIDYPGYGANGGAPSPESIQTGTAEALGALAAQLGLSPEALAPRCGVLGHSLGAAAALAWAGAHPVARIVLVAPFTSMLDMARRTVGWPLCQVLVHRFDNRGSLDRVLAAGAPPITILHGTADQAIPVAMGRELAARHPRAVALVEVPGAGHNDILQVADQAIYTAMMR